MDNEDPITCSLNDLVQLFNMVFRFLYLAYVINPPDKVSEITIHVHNAEDKHLHIPIFLLAGEVELEMDVVKNHSESQENVVEVCFY